MNRRVLFAGAGLVVVVGQSVVGVARATPAAPPARPCGAGAGAVLARTLGASARRIYEHELRGGSVSKVINTVQRSRELSNAVAAADPLAARAAVTHLVFSHQHIVRLRVTRAGRVLADVGGPDVLAPVRGDIRAHGRVVGRFVLSVQDDLGYVLLAGRLVGVDSVLRSGGRTVMSSLSPPPTGFIPQQGAIVYEGRTYLTYSFDALAFPSGPLRISLLVRRPAPPFGSLSCTRIEVDALGGVAETAWQRIRLSGRGYDSYVAVAHGLTGALVFVRRGGRQLAGSVRAGPVNPPRTGTLVFHRFTYEVSSFATQTAQGRAIFVYVLLRA